MTNVSHRIRFTRKVHPNSRPAMDSDLAERVSGSYVSVEDARESKNVWYIFVQYVSYDKFIYIIARTIYKCIIMFTCLYIYIHILMSGCMNVSCKRVCLQRMEDRLRTYRRTRWPCHNAAGPPEYSHGKACHVLPYMTKVQVLVDPIHVLLYLFYVYVWFHH